MSDLKVPFALDQGQKLLSPAFANHNGRYWCPACGAPVIVRAGPSKIQHFAHAALQNCTQEAIIRQVAKLLVKQAITEWKAGNYPVPIVERHCQSCDQLIEQPIPDKVEAASIDYQTPDGKMWDVALLVKGQAAGLLEIVGDDWVSDQWIEDGDGVQNQSKLPYIVVNDQALIQRHTAWRPLVDRFRPLTCSDCQAIFRVFQARATQIAQTTRMPLPTTFYRYGISRCWRCGKEILVFTWPGQRQFETERPAKDWLPPTLQYRFSKTAGSNYWANTCPYCRAIQGDFYLHSEVDSPFGGVFCTTDTPEAFQQDLVRIARKAADHGH